MPELVDADSILAALDDRVDDLAGQAFEVFVRQIPEARQWDATRRDKFVAQARGRFGAVLAVLDQGAEVDEALQHDLEAVGANAAVAGSSLPHLLIVLRISRDLLLREAMRIGVQPGVTEFASRLVPAVDRLTDALSRGFWSFTLDQVDEEREQFANILDEIPNGVYETDMDGEIIYANAALLGKLGVTDDVAGKPLSELIRVTGTPSVGVLFSEIERDEPVELIVALDDAPPIVISVATSVRRGDQGEPIGFGGIVSFPSL